MLGYKMRIKHGQRPIVTMSRVWVEKELGELIRICVKRNLYWANEKIENWPVKYKLEPNKHGYTGYTVLKGGEDCRSLVGLPPLPEGVEIEPSDR